MPELRQRLNNHSRHRLVGFRSCAVAAMMLAGCQSVIEQSETVEAANLEKAIYCMELLELHHDLQTAEAECFGDQYIQHTPWLPDGKQAVLELFARRLETNPEKTISIKRAGADGDLVWVHLHSQRFSGDEKGNAVINIFRMRDGKFVEHWNVVQRIPDESKNDNTMF